MSCAPSPNPSISHMILSSNEAPSGWIRFGEAESIEWGGESYSVSFAYGDNLHSPQIGHSIILYSSESEAIDGYSEYKNWIFTDIWKTPSESDFTPINLHDQFEYKCKEVRINGMKRMDCLILQQHNNLVSVLDIRMGEPLTFDEVNSILKSIDQNLNESN